jgi:hypothetical protein
MGKVQNSCFGLGMEGGEEMTWIPSDEDFARADRLDKEDHRNLEIVTANVKQRFMSISPLHNVYIMPQRDVNFRVYVFFKKDRDIADCKRSGITDSLSEFVRDELERLGRGKKEETSVAFEIDSDENVDRKFGGDYYARLH